MRKDEARGRRGRRRVAAAGELAGLLGAVWGFTLAGDAPAHGATVLLILAWVGVGANAAAIGRSRRAVYDPLTGTSVVRLR